MDTPAHALQTTDLPGPVGGAVVLVMYPAAFLSKDKFLRKMGWYTKNLVMARVLALDDPHGFIEAFATSAGVPFQLDRATPASCTHAVVFCHGEGFRQEIAALKNKPVPVRIVSLKLASVVNRDRGTPFDVYIGRGTLWGNPYPIGPAGDREEVLRKYQYDFDRRFLRFFDQEKANLDKIRGKVLGCHCKPLDCHGDILARYVNSLDDGE
jgi:hypothetical protein